MSNFIFTDRYQRRSRDARFCQLSFNNDHQVNLADGPLGIHADIAVSSVETYGVTIAPSVNNVVLRDLTINGQGGANGILMNSNGNLSIENVVTSITTATVRDTIVTGNIVGILAFSNIASANNRINVIRLTISNNGFGVIALNDIMGVSIIGLTGADY